MNVNSITPKFTPTNISLWSVRLILGADNNILTYLFENFNPLKD